MIASRMIQYGIRKEVKVRRQEIVEEEEVKCFRCWGIEHNKWKYPNIEVERRQQEEEAVYVVKLQKRHSRKKRS